MASKTIKVIIKAANTTKNGIETNNSPFSNRGRKVKAELCEKCENKPDKGYCHYHPCFKGNCAATAYDCLYVCQKTKNGFDCKVYKKVTNDRNN